MSNTFGARLPAALALLLALAVWLLAQHTADVRYPFGNDAIGYIAEAENVLNGRGLVRTPNETELPDLDYAPTRYQPPGFGLAVAAVGALGVGPERAALLISYGAWALLPFALMFALSTVLPAPWAIAVTALAVLSPGMYLFGSTVNADAPTLLLLVLAVGLAIRAVGTPGRARYLLAAGALLGVAYVLRNSITAVFAGFVAALVAAVVLRQMPASAASRHLMWIVAGSAPFIGLLLIRNTLVFGEAQPYVLMVGTDATLLESFRVFLDGLVWDLTGLPSLAKQLAWDFKLFLILVVPLAALVLLGLLKQWRTAPLHTRFAILFGLMFSAASAAMLVIAHTYHGLDFRFLLRHMMQFAWMLLALLVLAAVGFGNRIVMTAVGVIVAVLLVSRVWFIADDLRVERQMQAHFLATQDITEAARPFVGGGRVLTSQIRPALVRDPAVAAAVAALPGDALILSNHAPLLSHVSGRAVRTIGSPVVSQIPTIASTVDHIFRVMKRDRPVFLVLVPDNRMVRSVDDADWKTTVVQQLPQNFREVSRGNNFLVLSASRKPIQEESTR